jgi:hypothetical protein
MIEMVDSQQEELSVDDIIGIAGMNTDAGVDFQTLKTTIVGELNMPNSLFLRQGNTLFIIHKAAPGVGWFRALNADTAPNFLQNSMEFIKACNKMGFDTMATNFSDPTILSVFRYISQNPPFEGMGYQAQRTDDGEFYVTVNTGRQEIE